MAKRPLSSRRTRWTRWARFSRHSYRSGVTVVTGVTFDSYITLHTDNELKLTKFLILAVYDYHYHTVIDN